MVTIDPKEEEREEEEQNFGFISVQFQQHGSVFFDFDFGGVVPMQMIAIGEYLSTLGKSKLLQELARAEQAESKKQIQIPQPGIAPGSLSKVLKK